MSLIQCHFDYASSAWFNSLTQDLKHKLQVIQNRLIRCVVLKLNWLPVSSRISQIICHVFKINSKLAPSYLNDHFTPVINIHEKNTI